MSRQKLMLFSLILTMFLFGVACGETDQVSPDSADPSAKAESIAQEEAVDPAAEPELPSEAESKAGQTIAQPEEAETGGVNGDRVVEPGSGMIIADTGFRPETNGFSFPNFGADVNADNELTGFIVWDIFGDVVCSRIADDECEPTPAAQLWVKTVDRARAGGHCEGLAALSAALFRGEFSPEEDFGISTASELALSNDVLDQISEEWMIQAIEYHLLDRFYAHPGVREAMPRLEQAVRDGALSSFSAAQHLLALYHGEQDEDRAG